MYKATGLQPKEVTDGLGLRSQEASSKDGYVTCSSARTNKGSQEASSEDGYMVRSSARITTKVETLVDLV